LSGLLESTARNQTVAISLGNIALIAVLIYGSEFVSIAKAAKFVAKLLVGN